MDCTVPLQIQEGQEFQQGEEDSKGQHVPEVMLQGDQNMELVQKMQWRTETIFQKGNERKQVMNINNKKILGHKRKGEMRLR